MILPEDASLSALKHEEDHLKYDKENGYPGAATILSKEHMEIAETRAYNIEIEIAKSLDRPDLVERLRNQLIERLGSLW